MANDARKPLPAGSDFLSLQMKYGRLLVVPIGGLFLFLVMLSTGMFDTIAGILIAGIAVCAIIFSMGFAYVLFSGYRRMRQISGDETSAPTAKREKKILIPVAIMLFFLALMFFFIQFPIGGDVNSEPSNRLLTIIFVCNIISLLGSVGYFVYILYRRSKDFLKTGFQEGLPGMPSKRKIITRLGMRNNQALVMFISIFIFLAISFLFIFLDVSFFAVPMLILIFFWCYGISDPFVQKYAGSGFVWYYNIVKRRGWGVKSEQDGYTERPYSMKVIEFSKSPDWAILLETYAKRMLDHAVIAAYEPTSKAYLFYLQSEKILYFAPRGFGCWTNRLSKVAVHDDGVVSVNISRGDYDTIGTQATYHELCQDLIRSFADSFQAFQKGDEQRAVEGLGGKSYVATRRKELRSYTIVAVIQIVLMSISVMFMSFPMTASAVTYDDDVPNIGIDGLPSNGSKAIPIKADREMLLTRTDIIMQGDVFILDFRSNNINFSAEVIMRDRASGKETTLAQLENTTSGELKFTAPMASRSSEYFLSLHFNEADNMTQSVHVVVSQVNAVSRANDSLIFSLVFMSIVIPAPLTTWYIPRLWKSLVRDEKEAGGQHD